MKKITILLLIIPLFFTSCSKDENDPDPISINFQQLAIINVSGETEFNYLVLTKDSADYLLIKNNNSNANIPEYLYYYYSKSNKKLGVFYNNEGQIDKIMVDNYTLILRNIDNNKLDIGIIDPFGNTSIIRQIETNYNWQKNSLSNKKNKNASSLTELLSHISDTIDGIPCLMTLLDLSPSSAFECGLWIGDEIANRLTDNGFHIYASPEFIEDFESFFDFYDGFALAFNCFDGGIDCLFSGLSFVNNQFLNDYINDLENNSDIIYTVENDLINGYFKSEFFDLNDNQVPEGWEFINIGNAGADISNGRINSYIVNGQGTLKKVAQVSSATAEIILEMDANFVYSYWGNKGMFRINFGDKFLQFRAGEEDYDHPNGVSANEVIYGDSNSWSFIHEETSPITYGVYHLKLIMNEFTYEFIGFDPNGEEDFRINIDPSLYFNFRDIDQLRFEIYTSTDNASWIDNLRITVVE